MAKRLKIAVVVKSFNFYGGMERYAVEVATRLSKKGHQVDIYARQADDNLLEDGDMRFFSLSDSCAFSSVLSAVCLAGDLKKKLTGKNYDIVHSHERSYSQDVLTVHCFSYKGSFAEYSWLKRFDRQCLSPRSWLYLWLEKRQMQTKKMVAVSKAVKNDLAINYGAGDHLSIITPGVDIDHFRPAWVSENRDRLRKKMGIELTEKVIVFVGSEFKRKGLDYLIRALEKGWRLLVVGADGKTRPYQKIAEELGVRDQITFVGHTAYVRNYYAVADLVALPSRSEAFGMAILEGMACGLPVVTTANTGVSGLIISGENGFIVEKGEDLRPFFKEFFKRPHDVNLCCAARETARQYSWTAIADQYEQLFYKIAG